MPARSDATSRTSASAWYSQPVAWLGMAVFAASLAGCVWMIVLGARHADAPLDTTHKVFDVPVGAHSSHGPPR